MDDSLIYLDVWPTMIKYPHTLARRPASGKDDGRASLRPHSSTSPSFRRPQWMLCLGEAIEEADAYAMLFTQCNSHHEVSLSWVSEPSIRDTASTPEYSRIITPEPLLSPTVHSNVYLSCSYS